MMVQHQHRPEAPRPFTMACESAVLWRANEFGYSVEVFRRGEVVARHWCGNHAYDPERSVPLSSPEALSPAMLAALARKLALEMAEAFAIPVENVRLSN
ncbi:MAG TPA: hypothetical protein VE998_02710 [Terriglobales bacterium]|nr:hypothetical protein [Terriglobales bacterium]